MIESVDKIITQKKDWFYGKYGYRVEKVCCVDMFPGTVHVETVVLLSQLKQKPDDYINVTIELDDMDITSAETKATYGEGNCGGIEAF